MKHCESIREKIQLELDGERHQEVQEHLTQCAECRQYQASMTKLFGQLSQAYRIEIPETFTQSVMYQIAAEDRKQKYFFALKLAAMVSLLLAAPICFLVASPLRDSAVLFFKQGYHIIQHFGMVLSDALRTVPHYVDVLLKNVSMVFRFTWTIFECFSSLLVVAATLLTGSIFIIELIVVRLLARQDMGKRGSMILKPKKILFL